MTINELIIKYGKIIKNINNNISENHVITVDDVINNTICKRYNSNSINMLSNYGLETDGKNIYFKYNLVKGIKIMPNTDHIDCSGGTITLSCVAIIGIFLNDTEIDTIQQKINPIYSTDNCVLSKNNQIYFEPNYDFTDKEYYISAKYGYNTVIYNDKLVLHQSSNYVSDWIYDKDVIDNVYLKASTTRISNSGGKVDFKVYKEYHKIFYKKDYYDKLIDMTNSEVIIDDVSSETIFTVGEPYHIVNNMLILESQGINESAKTIIINWKYKNYKSFIEIYQDKGPTLTIKRYLAFDNSSNNKTLKLSSYENQLIKVPIISKNIRYLNNNFYDEIINNSISCYCSDKMLNVSYDNVDSNIELNIPKNNTTNNKYYTVTISNSYDIINLSIIQPCIKLNKALYGVNIECDEELDIKNINGSKIVFKPFKNECFEDGSIVTNEVLDNHLHLDTIILNSDENITISKPKMVDFNGLHLSYVKYNNSYIIDDSTIIIKCRLTNDNGEQVGVETEKIIKIKKTQFNYKNVELTVNVHNNKNIEVISLSNNTLNIFNSDNTLYKTIDLSNFWVNEYMLNDNVFTGSINLIEGETYSFKINQYITNTGYTNEKIDTYIIEQDDIGIDIDVDI